MGACRINSLTMSYFHTGIRTIIGAESFHCPVRDGKEWDQLAMVIRLNRWLAWLEARQAIWVNLIHCCCQQWVGINKLVESFKSAEMIA